MNVTSPENRVLDQAKETIAVSCKTIGQVAAIGGAIGGKAADDNDHARRPARARTGRLP